MKLQAGPILVSGATGNTGRPSWMHWPIAAPVRAMVLTKADRSKLRAGIVVVADFDGTAAVAAALDGAERAYLVTPSSEQAQDRRDHRTEPHNIEQFARDRAAAFAGERLR